MTTCCPNPQCRKELLWDDQEGEQTLQCPFCRQQFIVDATGIKSVLEPGPPPDIPGSPKTGNAGPTVGTSGAKRPGKSVAADILGCLSVFFGTLCCLVLLLGGVCAALSGAFCIVCAGCVGTPAYAAAVILGLLAVILGIVTIILGDRTYQRVLGAIGMVLPFVGLLLQLLGVAALISSIASQFKQLPNLR
jgi:hypothetical protein